jgi:hypothetical protein
MRDVNFFQIFPMKIMEDKKGTSIAIHDPVQEIINAVSMRTFLAYLCCIFF